MIRTLIKKGMVGVLLTVGSVLLSILILLIAMGLYYHHIVTAPANQLKVSEQPGVLGQWVNPFSGTGGIPYMCANNFPGVCRPFGMVRLGPETASIVINKRALNTAGYYYGDNKIIGFSHTRLIGTGAVDGGHFLVRPAIGENAIDDYRRGKNARFSHTNERAFPGYYAVRFNDSEILAEITTTIRTGVHRYTFPAGSSPHLIIDVSNALGGKRSDHGWIRVIPENNEVEGSIRTFGTFGGRYGGLTVFFIARFTQPFNGYSCWNGDVVIDSPGIVRGDTVGVDVRFHSSHEPQVIGLRLAISHVSVDNARLNLQAETDGKYFYKIVDDARRSWEEKLSLIEIDGGADDQRSVFYTALYRVFQMPTIFSDVNGDYMGFDKLVHRASHFRYFTDLSLWDTFRTVHPLYTLIAPKDQRDMVVSLVTMAKQGGWLPRWPSGCGYTNSMLGTPADIVISEAWQKGIRDFDVQTAYAAIRRTALNSTPSGAAFSGREGVAYFKQYGFYPADKMKEAVSRTLEFGWADAAIARLADSLGYKDDALLFAQHACSYQHVWNSETQFFQPRNSDNSWQPIKPTLLTYLDRTGKFTNDYVEGSAWQWRWCVLYDAEGLMSLFKSKLHFIQELNTFFEKATWKMGPWNPGAYYWHGNEPDIHAAYLFNVAGRSDLTRKWVHHILENKYRNDAVGLDGNDDAGTLSAWYVFSALGFYPIAGTDCYELGMPLFRKAVVHIGPQPLIVVADSLAPTEQVQVYWNDVPLKQHWIRHKQIQHGGVLAFRAVEKM